MWHPEQHLSYCAEFPPLLLLLFLFSRNRVPRSRDQPVQGQPVNTEWPEGIWTLIPSWIFIYLTPLILPTLELSTCFCYSKFEISQGLLFCSTFGPPKYFLWDEHWVNIFLAYSYYFCEGKLITSLCGTPYSIWENWRQLATASCSDYIVYSFPGVILRYSLVPCFSI